MLDPQLLRKDLESVKTRLATRKFELDTALFMQLETERKELQGRTEELQAKRNQLAKAIGMKKNLLITFLLALTTTYGFSQTANIPGRIFCFYPSIFLLRFR